MFARLLIYLGKPFYFLLHLLLEFFVVTVSTQEPTALNLNHQKNKDKKRIFDLVKKFHSDYHANTQFTPGMTYIKASGATYDEQEMINMADVALDFWLTEGVKTAQFSQKLRQFTGNQFVSLTVSGSSANLLAFSALTSKKLQERQIKPGDEVITAACGFPTTVNPIIQNRAVPVFVDVDVHTLNVSPKSIEEAITPKTKAIMLAHTLGFPFQADKIRNLAKKHNLWFIEDSCDALGATIDNKPITSFGDISTVSFFPAHQITTGEGGVIFTNNALLYRTINTFRDWGRDCWCKPGDDNTCQKRFAWQLGKMPLGYDHKYIYSEIGYNMRLTEMQSAIGLAQIDKVANFIVTRRRNYAIFRQRLEKYDHLFFPIKVPTNINPSPFGYVLNLRPDQHFNSTDLINHLETHKVATRRIFGGNLLHQPAYQDIKHRQIGSLSNSNHLLQNAIWIGLHPGITAKQIEYVCDTIDSFIESH